MEAGSWKLDLWIQLLRAFRPELGDLISWEIAQLTSPRLRGPKVESFVSTNSARCGRPDLGDTLDSGVEADGKLSRDFLVLCHGAAVHPM